MSECFHRGSLDQKVDARHIFGLAPTIGTIPMALRYSAPDAILQRELEEVARDAHLLLEGLAQANALGEDFPAGQLKAIATSLADISNGTAQGCKATLEYARARLPAIRREYVVSSELHVFDPKDEKPPPTLRGEDFDRRLRDLIASVTTALDEYRRQATEPEKLDESPAPAIENPDTESIAQAIEKAPSIERSLAEVHKQLKENAAPESSNADSLGRQIKDAESLTRLAEAELESKRIVVRWYRGIVSAARQYPAIIHKTGNGIRVAVDVVEPLINWWHEFKHGIYKAALDGFRDFGETLEQIADQLEQGQNSNTAPTVITTPDDNYWPKQKIKDYFIEGRKIPAYISETVLDLSFGNTSVRLKTIEGISQFKNLRSLGLSYTRVPSLRPLDGLSSLMSLDLTGAHFDTLNSLPLLPALSRLNVGSTYRLKDIDCLRAQTSLSHLNISSSHVSDLSPCEEMLKLATLSCGGTRITDFTALGSLPRLSSLAISHSVARDFSTLAKLQKLQKLSANNTALTDLTPVSSLSQLNYLDISATGVSDLKPLLGLKVLEFLNITSAKVQDAAVLGNIPSLRTLYYSGRVKNLDRVKKFARVRRLVGR